MGTKELLSDLYTAKDNHQSLHRHFYEFCKHVNSFHTVKHLAEDFLEGGRTDLEQVFGRDETARELSSEMKPRQFKLFFIDREYVFRFFSEAFEGRLVGKIDCVAIARRDGTETMIDQLVYDHIGQTLEVFGAKPQSIQALDFIKSWIVKCVHKDILR